MIIGNPSVFALESEITQAYIRPSLLALGFFCIHVAGKRYGVHCSTATMLAHSLNSAKRRVAQRGRHRIFFALEPNPLKIADAVSAVKYRELPDDCEFLGMSRVALRSALKLGEIVWAPDGDAAFDDGGHILQIDHDDKVRLIGFTNFENSAEIEPTIADLWMKSDEFYTTIQVWIKEFESSWTKMPKVDADDNCKSE